MVSAGDLASAADLASTENCMHGRKAVDHYLNVRDKKTLESETCAKYRSEFHSHLVWTQMIDRRNEAENKENLKQLKTHKVKIAIKMVPARTAAGTESQPYTKTRGPRGSFSIPFVYYCSSAPNSSVPNRKPGKEDYMCREEQIETEQQSQKILRDATQRFSANLPKDLDENKRQILEHRSSLSDRFRGKNHGIDNINLFIDQDNSADPLYNGSCLITYSDIGRRTLVYFGYVEIQEYPITLGDNPGGSYGPPLSIEWLSSKKTKLKVEEFENMRKNDRRQLDELRTTPKYRVELLRRAGISIIDMYTASREAERIRSNRHWTHGALGRMHLEERMETALRTLRNILTFGRYKRKELRFPEQCVPSYHASRELASRSRVLQ